MLEGLGQRPNPDKKRSFVDEVKLYFERVVVLSVYIFAEAKHVALNRLDGAIWMI